jgi:hypothetical protein
MSCLRRPPPPSKKDEERRMTRTEAGTTPTTDEDWPRCRRCDDYEWNHRGNALGHRMSWPPLTAREKRVMDRIMEALS